MLTLGQPVLAQFHELPFQHTSCRSASYLKQSILTLGQPVLALNLLCPKHGSVAITESVCQVICIYGSARESRNQPPYLPLWVWTHYHWAINTVNRTTLLAYNNNNNNNNRIQRRNSRFFTISSLRHKLSPTCTL